MKWIAALIALALVVLTGCGDDEEPVASDDGDRASVDGNYRSVTVTERGEERALVGDTVVALQLDGGDLTASAGCNTIGGSYSVDDATLVVPDGLHMTEMACEPELMDQDSWLVELLTSGPEMEVTDDGLALVNETTSIRFVHREIADPDADLVGTRWTVTGFMEGDTAMSTSSDNPGSLLFEENGFVTGHDGCNSLGYSEGGDQSDGLRYEVDGDQIRYEGSPVQTLIGCDDPDVDRFHAVLSGTVTWEIEASNLTLTAEDGSGVTYTAAD